MKKTPWNCFPRTSRILLALAVSAIFSPATFAGLVDVTNPGDPIVATSFNTPIDEGVTKAIDNTPAKYRNLDRLNTGFTVWPASGVSIVRALSLTSANDAPERDPASYLLEGSVDSVDFMTISSGTVAAFPSRFHTNTISFANDTPYSSYRLIFPEVVGPGANSMQISEVELLGTYVPEPGTMSQTAIAAISILAAGFAAPRRLRRRTAGRESRMSRHSAANC